MCYSSTISGWVANYSVSKYVYPIPTYQIGAESGEVTDSCTCAGLNTDWEINMTDYCNITLNCDLGTGMLNFIATGVTNKFPMYDPIPDYTIKENQNVTFIANVTDDDGDPVTCGARNIPQGAQFDSLGSKQFSWTPDYTQAGEYVVHFMAWDDKNGLDNEPVKITVENVNRVPQIVGYLPLAYNITGHYNYGEIFHFIIQVTDADYDDLEYKWYNNDLLVSTKNYYDCKVTEQSLGGHKIIIKVYIFPLQF